MVCFGFFNIYLFWLWQVLVAGMRTLSCDMWALAPWPGIEPGPPALGAWSLSHWTTREVPSLWFDEHDSCRAS